METPSVTQGKAGFLQEAIRNKFGIFKVIQLPDTNGNDTTLCVSMFDRSFIRQHNREMAFFGYTLDRMALKHGGLPKGTQWQYEVNNASQELQATDPPDYFVKTYTFLTS